MLYTVCKYQDTGLIFSGEIQMNRKLFLPLVCCMIVTATLIPGKAFSDELIVKSCTELIRMAENLQEDVKTADMMLRSALDGGSMSSVKTYKLKKEAVNIKLQSVLQAISLKGCSKPM